MGEGERIRLELDLLEAGGGGTDGFVRPKEESEATGRSCLGRDGEGFLIEIRALGGVGDPPICAVWLVENGEHGIREAGNEKLGYEVPQSDAIPGEEDMVPRLDDEEGECLIFKGDGADLGDGRNLRGDGSDGLGG